MKEMVDLLFRWVEKRPPQELISADTTVYKVKTSTGIYCGQIIFQDEIRVKIKTDGPRIVKVLKQNIQRIEIVILG